tara:strand:- start:558 stop:2285 length:1728 start_codon:yes stop_codon:yes gene_type:complete
MATHDYVLDNATGANFRSDLNNALAAIVSNNSSSTEPSTKYAYQWWADTNEGVLKIRNSANDGWVTLLQLDGTLTLEDGTNSAPALGFRDDLNTGIFSSAADTLDITCGGTTRGSFSSSGLTVTGNVTATTFVGNIDAVDGDFDGTLEADAITVAGVALSTVIAGTTVTTATNANHISVADNESTNEENLIPFIEDASATGNVGLESDGDFSYNPSTGTVTATIFKGNIDAVDGDFDGTLEADAITVAGVALNTVIAGVTVTNATNASHVSVADNESTNENNLIPFIEDASATGNVGLESDGDFTYNPSTGTVTATKFVGDGSGLTGVGGSVGGNNGVDFNDNVKARFGTGNDLEIFHNGSDSFIKDVGTGRLLNCGSIVALLSSDAGEFLVRAVENLEVELYYNGVEKLNTKSTGINVIGNVHAAPSGTTFATDNDTYVIQAAAPSQAYMSAYAANDGTNLFNHGFHFGIDTTSANLIVRQSKPINFYTNDSHRLTLDANGHLLPAATNSFDLGSTSKKWRNVFTNDLNLSNEGGANDVDSTWGSFKIQEGHHDLFLINNRTGKKFKFNLTEVS